MSKKTTTQASSKKAPRKSASAARAEGAASQQRERHAKADSPVTTPTATKPAKTRRVSLLDAAATVLTGAKAPMQAKAVVDAVVERGLWKPGAGKTPHATLYAAIIREIAAKGKDARFRKVDRGQFAGN